MIISMDELLRRLVLLGLPLVQVSCSNRQLQKLVDGSTDVYVLNDANGGSGGIGGITGGGGVFGAGGTGGMPGVGGVGGTGGRGGIGFWDAGSSCGPTFEYLYRVSRSGTVWDTIPPALNWSSPFNRPVEAAAWDKCETNDDCLDLCNEVAQLTSPQVLGFGACQNVRPGDPVGDGGIDPPDAGPMADAGDPTLDLLTSWSYLCSGRRPEGHMPGVQTDCGSPIGRWLAQTAALEAASVPAFQRLARELAAHGAPRRLVRAARRAARDEVRHWRLMSGAARAHGARPTVASVKPLPVRPLFEIAAENAAEGCVRETFGAATAAYQARHARDPLLRALMTTIALDEARHGLLAWEIDLWARAALDAGASRALSAQRRGVADEIVRDAAAAPAPDPSLVNDLGLPPPTAVQQLAAQANRLLWHDAIA